MIPHTMLFSLTTGKNCTGEGGDSIFSMASTAIASAVIVLGFLLDSAGKLDKTRIWLILGTSSTNTMKDMTPQIYGTEHYLHKTVDIEHQRHLFSLNVTMNRRICSLVYRLERSEKQERCSESSLIMRQNFLSLIVYLTSKLEHTNKVHMRN